MLKLLLFFLLIPINVLCLDDRVASLKNRSDHLVAEMGDDSAAKFNKKAEQFFQRYDALRKQMAENEGFKKSDAAFQEWMIAHIADRAQLEAGIEKWSKEHAIFGECIQFILENNEVCKLSIEAMKLGRDFIDELHKWMELQGDNIEVLEKGIPDWERKAPGLKVFIQRRIEELKREKRVEELVKKWQVSPHKRILDMIWPSNYASEDEGLVRADLRDVNEIASKLSLSEKDQFFILLGKYVLRGRRESFQHLIKYLTEFYSISPEQIELILRFIEHSPAKELDFIKCVIPAIPSELVNNNYGFLIREERGDEDYYLREEQKPLWYAVQYYKRCKKDDDYNLALVKQLLDKGADPLLADGEGYQIVRSLPYDRYNGRTIGMRHLLFPLIESQVIARKKVTLDTLASLPAALCDLCSEYEYDLNELHNDQLLQLMTDAIYENKEYEESIVLEGMEKALKNKPYSCQYAMINRKDCRGRTPLMHAAKRGYAKAVEKLIRKGAVVEAEDQSKRNALWFAVSSRSKKAFDIASRILQSAHKGKKDVAAMINKVPVENADDKRDMGPLDEGSVLFCAVVEGDAGLVELLLEHRADPLIEGGRALADTSGWDDKTIYNMLQERVKASSQSVGALTQS